MISPEVEPFNPAVRCGMFLPDLLRGENLGNFGGVNSEDVIGQPVLKNTYPQSRNDNTVRYLEHDRTICLTRICALLLTSRFP